MRRVRALRATLLAAVLAAAAAGCRASRVPETIDDGAFWALIESISEPPGSFTISDNFVSNEPRVAENARWIRARGGVYVGVGPEQNFTYIAALRPAIAFVIDIRRENRTLHLLYKALFELSADRADFVARLFSRPRPPGLDTGSTAAAIFERYAAVRPSIETRDTTAALVRDRLLRGHGFPMTADDLALVDRALAAFAADGPDVQFWSSGSVKTDRP